MSETATKLIKEAVLRALQKSPADITFYRERENDHLLPPAYRQTLREAITEWVELQKTLRQ